MKSDYWDENDVLWGVIKDLVHYIELKENILDDDTFRRLGEYNIRRRALLAISYLEEHQETITDSTKQIELCDWYSGTSFD